MIQKPFLGIIGSGSISRFHLLALKKAGFILHSISSSVGSESALRLKNEFSINKFYESANEHIESKCYDALVFVTPSEITLDYLLLVNESTKVLAEKPISHSATRLALIEARENIKVAFNRRHYSTINELKNIIDSGVILSLKIKIPESVGFNQSPDGVYKRSRNRVLYHNLYENSVHVYDALRYLVGPYCMVSKRLIYRNEGLIAGFYATFTSTKVQNIEVESIFNSPDNFSIVGYTGNRRFELEPLETFTEYFGIEISEPDHDYPLRKYTPKKTRQFFEGVSSGSKPGFENQARMFYEFCQGRQTNLANVSDLIESIKIIDEILNADG